MKTFAKVLALKSGVFTGWRDITLKFGYRSFISQMSKIGDD